MSRLKALTGVCLIFLFGMAVGGMGAAKWMERRIRAAVRGDAELVSDLIIRRLVHELKLTQAQRAPIKTIVAEGRREIERVRHQTEPEVQGVVREMQTSIRAQLDQAQAARFDQMNRSLQSDLSPR